MRCVAITVDLIELAVADGARVIAYDLAPGSRPIAIVEYRHRLVVRFGSGAEAVLPVNSRGLEIAACDIDAAVVVAYRTARKRVNAWVVSPYGIEAACFAGDAVQDVIA
jgi:hypothetical protein